MVECIVKSFKFFFLSKKGHSLKCDIPYTTRARKYHSFLRKCSEPAATGSATSFELFQMPMAHPQRELLQDF